MVEARIPQGGINALIGNVPEAQAAQGGIYALIDTGVPARIAQAGVNALVAITAEVRVPQAGFYLLAGDMPCVSELCQVWRIVRTDGEVFRFTSLDHDWIWLGEEYKSCDSLNPTASENVARADEAGNMDLSGAVGPDGITLRDLYMGLFDGAVADVWLVPYEGRGRQHLLIRGTFGPVEQTDTGFKVELVGDGAKLLQTPIISVLQPDCRWEFGDPDTCGVDLGPLTVTGTVGAAVGQRQFFDLGRAEAAGYFSRGRVTFTGGDNAGVSAEIKVHEAGGAFYLWPRLPFGISAGDPYEMTPGCTNLFEAVDGTNGCTGWNNKRRYGGFRKVPGGDKRSSPAKVR